MAVTEVAKGAPNPGPAGPGVSHGGTRQESLGRGFRESGNEQSPNSREPRDVEGVPVTETPSSRSSGSRDTTDVSGRNTVATGRNEGFQMEGSDGPRVSSTPAVLVSQHWVDSMTTAHRKRKRKNEDVGQLRRQGETHLADKILAAQARGETRVQIRHMKQKHRRKALRKPKQQTKRTRAIRAAAQKHLRIRAKQNKAVKRIKIMTWNARGWGAAYTTLDPRIKAQCLVNMAEVRGIGLIVFTDLKFPQQELRTYHTETSKFVLLVTGTIGFLMNAQWHQWWVEGGQQWVMPEPQGNNRIRSAAIVFPRKGWRRGLYVIGVYAPTSSARKSELTDCIKQVQALLDKTPGSFMRIVAGDCNAELGTGTHGDWQDALGDHGAQRRSRWGGRLAREGEKRRVG